MSIDGEDNTTGESQIVGKPEDLKEPQVGKLEKKLLIQFGSFVESIKVNTAFLLSKTFGAKEGQYLVEDEINEVFWENDPAVMCLEFILPNECDLIYAFETLYEEMTKRLRPLFIKACLNRVTLKKHG